jgi:hypothetical protein
MAGNIETPKNYREYLSVSDVPSLSEDQRKTERETRISAEWNKARSTNEKENIAKREAIAAAILEMSDKKDINLPPDLNQVIDDMEKQKIAQVASADQKKAEELGTWEKLKNWSKKELDVSKWSTKKKAIIATATIGTIGLLAWMMFRKKKGSSSEKKSWFRKILPYIPVIGLLGVGAYVAHGYLKKNVEPYARLVQKANDTLNDVNQKLRNLGDGASKVGDAVVDVGTDAASGLGQGIEEVSKNFDEAFPGGMFFRTREALEEGKSWKETLWVAMKDGLQIGLVDGVVYMWHSGKYVAFSTKEAVEAGIDIFTSESEEVVDKMGELVKIYIGTSVVYASSLSILDFAWLKGDLGARGAAKQSLKRAAGWPYEVYRKSGVKYGVSLARPGRKGVLGRVEFATAARKPKYMWNRISGKFGEWNTQYMDDLFDEWKSWKRLYSKIEKSTGGEVTRDILNHRMNTVKDRIAKGIKKGIVPKYLNELTGHDDFLRAISRTHVDEDALHNALVAASRTTDDAEAISSIKIHVPDEADEVVDAAKSSTKPRPVPDTSDNPAPPKSRKVAGGGNAYEVDAKPAPKPADTRHFSVVGEDGISRDPFVPETMKKSVDEAGDLVSQINKARKAGNNELLKKLLSDPVLENLAKHDEAAARLVRASKWAKRMKYGSSMGLAALINVGILWFKQSEIKSEDNPEIKKVLEDERSALIKEMVGSEAAIALAIKSLPASAGGLASLGAAGIITAPIIGAQMYSSKVSEYVKDSRREVKDWIKQDSGQLISTINSRIAEGSHGMRIGHRASKGETFFGKLWRNMVPYKKTDAEVGEEQFKAVEKENWNQRNEIYMAYFLKNSRMNAKEGADLDNHIMAKMKYVSVETEGGFDMTLTSVFEDADTWAELASLREQEGDVISYKLPGEEEKKMDLKIMDGINDRRNLYKIKLLLNQYRSEYKVHRSLMEWASLSASVDEGDKKSEEGIKNYIKLQVLDDIRHVVNKTEHQIESTRVSSSDKNVVRLHIHDAINDAVIKLAEDAYDQNLTPEEFSERLDKIKGYATPPVDINKFAKSIKSPLRKDVRGLGAAGAAIVHHAKEEAEKRLGYPVEACLKTLVP